MALLRVGHTKLPPASPQGALLISPASCLPLAAVAKLGLGRPGRTRLECSLIYPPSIPPGVVPHVGNVGELWAHAAWLPCRMPAGPAGIVPPS